MTKLRDEPPHDQSPRDIRIEKGPGYRQPLATPSIAVFALLVVAAGGFGLYEITHARGKPTTRTGACARSLTVAQAIDARGEVAALMPAHSARDLSGVSFDDANGRKVTIGAFAGRTVLLNLWATWCVPCRTEMPALDRLQAARGSPAFGVVPVNVDQLRLEKARAFFKDTGVLSLPYFSDSTDDILRALDSQGLPTTVLIGPDGCEIATMAGPAQWDSPEAVTVIAKATRPQDR